MDGAVLGIEEGLFDGMIDGLELIVLLGITDGEPEG